MTSAIKTFEVEEGTIPGGRYRITVKFGRKIVDTFTKNRMDECNSAFRAAGYQRVAWAEGARIVCQTEN